jgi:ferredoxin-thioredoxin reductase catalytic subunit
LDEEELLEFCKKYAARSGFALNPNSKIVMLVIRGLLENERKYGFRYCPCRVISGNKEKDAKIVCPCAWHKQEINKKGSCLCGLFVKK